MQRARKVKLPPMEYLFTDVFDEMPQRLQQQWDQLKEHLAKYRQHYPVDKHDSGNS